MLETIKGEELDEVGVFFKWNVLNIFIIGNADIT